MRLKAVSLVLVEGDIKARQGGVCGKMRLKAVSLVLVEAILRLGKGEFVVRCG